MGSVKHDLEKQVHRLVKVVEATLDRSRKKLGLLPGVEDVTWVDAYAGYATVDQVIVTGRMLANPPAAEAEEEHKWWENFGSMWRRVNSDEVIGAEVLLTYAGIEQKVKSDHEGYYQAVFDRVDPGMDESLAGMWSTVVATVPGADGDVCAEHPVLTPPMGAKFGIISDMDDTVIHTGATQLLLMARQTLFGNAKLRQPLAGVAALYHALQRGQGEGIQSEAADRSATPAAAMNPLFYVSSSPWNLYGLLVEFLAHNGIPQGPLLLRDYGVDDTKLVAEKGHGHKLEKAERILSAYPDLPFVLLGDSGQDDAEIYAELAHRHPDRLRAIYIRDVDPDRDTTNDERVDRFIEKGSASGVPMMRANDSLAMAEHAAEIGLITRDSVALVAADVERDREIPETPGEELQETVSTGGNGK